MVQVSAPAYRIRAGQYLALVTNQIQAYSIGGRATLIYEDGSDDTIDLPETALSVATTGLVVSQKPAAQNGWVVEMNAYIAAGTTTPFFGAAFVTMQIVTDQNASRVVMILGSGYIGVLASPSIGDFDSMQTPVEAQLDVTYTQSGAGSITLDIVPATTSTYSIFTVVSGKITYTGTNSINVIKNTAAGGSSLGTWDNVASVASATINFPGYHVNANTTADTSLAEGWPILPRISGTQSLLIQAPGAGGGLDVIQVTLSVLILGSRLPTVTKGGGGTWAVSAGSAAFVVVG